MTASEHLRIATRKSPLALAQARTAAARLQAAHPGLRVSLVQLSTSGDRVQDRPLAEVGGKGLFVKELEASLLDGRADLAVHSMKDVPGEIPPGLHLPATLAREDPRDALVSNHYAALEALPAGARVGTSSLRRQCQLSARFPRLHLANLRGNVGTRLAKLDRDECDAIVLAVAGLKRLELTTRIRAPLDPIDSLPAIGQGAIGLECRQDDPWINALIAAVDDAPTRICVQAERALSLRLGASCETPVAALAELQGDRIYLRGLVGHPDGRRVIRAEGDAGARDASGLGRKVAENLLAQGADKILRELGIEVGTGGP